MKKIDFSMILACLLLLLCFGSVLMAIRFEYARMENLFTLCAGVFMVFFGFLLSITTKMKWTEKALKKGK